MGNRRNRWNWGNVNVMNVDGDIIDGGCNEEVLSDGVIGEERVE